MFRWLINLFRTPEVPVARPFPVSEAYQKAPKQANKAGAVVKPYMRKRPAHLPASYPKATPKNYPKVDHRAVAERPKVKPPETATYIPPPAPSPSPAANDSSDLLMAASIGYLFGKESNDSSCRRCDDTPSISSGGGGDFGGGGASGSWESSSSSSDSYSSSDSSSSSSDSGSSSSSD